MVRDFTKELGYLPLGSRLKRVGERMQAETARFLANEGIEQPPGIWPLLATLHGEGALTVGELATALGVSQPGVTRSLRQLTADGMVKPAPAGEDQRRKPVMLTDAGAAVVERCMRDLWPYVEAAVREMCTPLDGPILQQLDRIEEELDSLPLDRRAARKMEARDDG
jgi:DNA-binding MarR family transcriptional regulator